MSIFITGDDAVFIDGSIHEVLLTLALSVVIVVAIIYVFLRDLRATLIPSLTIPVALIGALAAIYVAGFSVNILTLLALVLSTGLVVDDAIVVLENIVRRRAQGMGPRAAAVLGTEQVFFAVVATTTTLAAVFVPLVLPAGAGGGALPRVRHRARHGGRDLGGGGAVALPDDGLADAGGRQGPQRRALGAARRGSAACWSGSITGRCTPRSAAPMVVLALAAILGVTSWLLFAGHPAGGDAARGPLGGAAPGDRAAGGEPRLYREQAARDRGAHGGPARLGRGDRALLDRRAAADSDNSGFIIFTLAPWGEREREPAGDRGRHHPRGRAR